MGQPFYFALISDEQRYSLTVMYLTCWLGMHLLPSNFDRLK